MFMLDMSIEKYKEKIRLICRVFPLDVRVFTYKDAVLSEYSSHINKVFQTGMLVDLSLHGNDSHGREGLFVPVKMSGQVRAVCFVTPKEETAWFHENKKWIIEFIKLNCEWMSIEIDKDELKKQNELFRTEIKAFFSLTDEKITIFSPDGVVQEVSEGLAVLTEEEKVRTH